MSNRGRSFTPSPRNIRHIFIFYVLEVVMGYLRNLCETKDITLEELSNALELDFNALDNADLGFNNFTTGKYHHAIKEYFGLDPLIFLKFVLNRKDKIDHWNSTLTDEMDCSTKEGMDKRNEHICACMYPDDYYQYKSDYDQLPSSKDSGL